MCHEELSAAGLLSLRKDRTWTGRSSWSSSRSPTSTGRRPSIQGSCDADHDHAVSDKIRFVQLTPPGSGCSIAVGKGLSDAVPGSLKGVKLVVDDIEVAHNQLRDRGVDVSDIQDGAGSSSSVTLTGWSVQQLPPRP